MLEKIDIDRIYDVNNTERATTNDAPAYPYIDHNDRKKEYDDVYSGDQIELDLAELESGQGESEYILSLEQNKMEFRNACIGILKNVGSYLNPDRVHEVFPGLDMNDIDSYDFNNSMIRFFVLTKENYEIMEETLYGSNVQSSGISTTFHAMFEDTEGGGSKVMAVMEPVDFKRPLIVINDSIKDGSDPGSIRRQRRYIFTHEIMHVLVTPGGFSSEAEEARVELSTRMSDFEDLSKSAEIGSFYGGYEKEVATLMLLMRIAEQGGMSKDKVCKALLSQDEGSFNDFRTIVEQKTGEEFFTKFFYDGLGDYDSFKNAISALRTLPENEGIKDDERYKLLHPRQTII